MREFKDAAERTYLVQKLRENNWNKVALLVGTDATGRLAEPEFVTVAAMPENREMSMVTVEHFNPTDVTIAAQVAQTSVNATATILVGSVLGADELHESALYSTDYQRRFRGRS